MVETRRSTGFFLILTWIRPSCGRRFSAMLIEPLMILSRLIMADCRRFGGDCISCITPSMRKRTRDFFETACVFAPDLVDDLWRNNDRGDVDPIHVCLRSERARDIHLRQISVVD